MLPKQKILVICAAAILAVAGIGAAVMYSGSDDGDGKLKVAASFYAVGYFAEQIGGDRVSVTTLIPENTELHSWSPKTSDILAAVNSDVFLYNGAGLEPWVESELLSAMNLDKTTAVETASKDSLMVGDAENTRLFVFDNDGGKTYSYDVSEDIVVLSGTVPGSFNAAVEAVNSEGYVFLFMPTSTSITVLNTGLHGDHFHNPETVMKVEVGSPVHYSVSPDGQYIAFALDTDNAAIVMNVNKPAEYDIYEFPGESPNSHATVVIDSDNMLYFADMRESADKNLWIVDIENKSVVRSAIGGGDSPHGGFYSSAMGRVYLNCADGIAVIGVNGVEKTIPYKHGDTRLGVSWVSEDGTKLISYIGDASLGLACSKIVAYDLRTGSLVADISVSIPIKDADGSPSAVLTEDILAVSDPKNGTVTFADISTGKTKTVTLKAEKQAIGLAEDGATHMIWAVTEDGTVYYISPFSGEIVNTYEAESGFGNNILISAVTADADEHDHEEHDHDEEDHDEHEHGIYDPHTWISPYSALKQAEAVYNAFVEKDKDNASYYLERWTVFKEKLEALDEAYMTGLSGADKDVIFVNHEAYGYLADRYGFEQEGIIGISADEQPSPSAISNLVNEMIEHDIYVVYLDPVYSDQYTMTLKSSVEEKTGKTVEIKKMYLMTGTVDGLDYLGQMEYNLTVLKAGLGAA
ncbi:MAG: zinc ABC transporter substrate-binding protein [Candidatus Methanoplasma sp.]|jgi:zinc transport system substrate-binding protein|nr:zinc ABC transporter substrate-binding protein [Candidatus Methanoplasma sp.]